MLKRLSLLITLLLLLPAQSFALDMEYHCYNGFDPIVTAFQKVTLIFGAGDYKGMIFSMAVIGILFGGIMVYLKVFMGGRLALGAWATPFFVGVILYFGLIVPTGNLTIQDDVLNRFQIVQGVPNGIVALAGVTNLIERSIIELIDLANPPGTPTYKQSAGGIGFDLLMSATGGDVSGKTPNAYMTASLDRFIRDCVTFEIQRPGSQINLDTLLNSTGDIRTQLAQASNPSIFTVFYDASNPQGASKSCADSWTGLNAYLTDTSFNQSVSAICSNAGIDATNVTEFASCQNIVSSHISYFTSNGVTPSYLIMQAVLSNMINDAILYADPDTAARVLANKNQMSTGIGLGLMASEWLPVAKAVVTATAVGLVPFVVLLIPTPLSGRALQLLSGFFIWLTAWGVTDAVINSLGVSMAYNVFNDIRMHNYSLASMMAFPGASAKAFAMFGMIRSAGIGLATVMTTILIRFGGAALSSMAGSITASIQSQGGEAGRTMGTPEGIAREIKESNTNVPVMANAMSYNWNKRTLSEGNQLDNRTGSGLGWGSGGEAFATGFGSTAVNAAVQRQKISDSGSFGDWVRNEAVTGGMALMSGTGKRVTWDQGMNSFRNDYMKEHPNASPQETRTAGMQFFGAFYSPDKGVEAYQALKNRGVPASDAFNEMVRMGTFTSEKGYAFTDAQMNLVKRYSADHKMTPRQVMTAWGGYDVANTAAMMEAFKTPENYEKFRTMAYGLDAAQQRGIVEAAKTAGYDPADSTQMASYMKHLETIGAVDMYRNKKINDQDLLLIGGSKALAEKGMAHARDDIAHITGMSIDKVEEFMRTREGLLAYARFTNMETFANKHGQSFLDLAKDSQRTMGLDVDGKQAAAWGLPGAGHYTVSWNRQGGYVFTDKKSGTQYQVGVFGQSGRSEYVRDEKGNITFHGSNATFGDQENRRSFTGNIDGYDFENAVYERNGNMVTVTGKLKEGGTVSLTAKTVKDKKGGRQYEVQSVVDNSGVRFSKESAVAQVQRGKVRGEVYTNAQAREAFADSYVSALQSTRSMKAMYDRGTTLDGKLNFGGGGSPFGSAGSHPRKLNTGSKSFSAGFGIGSSHRANEQQAIDEQKVQVMKVIEDSKGNGFAAAEKLRKMWVDNTGDSSFRTLNLFRGGAPDTGYIEKKDAPKRFEPSGAVFQNYKK